MNKKTLFSILLSALALPVVALAAGGSVMALAAAAATNALYVADAVVIIGWVITGILFLTAGGGSGVENAKKALFAVIIGTILVVILHTVGALNFVSNSLS